MCVCMQVTFNTIFNVKGAHAIADLLVRAL